MLDCMAHRIFGIGRISVRSFVIVVILLSSTVLIPFSQSFYTKHFTANALYTRAIPASGGPTVDDPNLKVEVVAKGLHVPTSMAFLGPDDILVLEKNSGNVLRVLNGEILK